MKKTTLLFVARSKCSAFSVLSALAFGACAASSSPASRPVAAAAPAPVKTKKASVETKYDNSAVEAELDRGLQKERERDFDGARTEYQGALKVDSSNVDATIGLSRVLVAQNKLELADKLLEAARKSNGDKSDFLLAQAQVARASKKPERAIELARKVLLKDQGNADALNFIALVYAEQNKLDLAEVYALNAQKFAPKSAQIMTTLGFIYAQRGDRPRALAQFQKATEAEGNAAIAHANIGFIALENRDYTLAKNALDKSFELGRSSKDVLAGRCYSREGLRLGKEAAGCFSELIARLGPNDGDAASYAFTLGSIQQNLNRDNDAALAAYKKYVELKGTTLAKNDRVFDLMKTLEAKKVDNKPAEAPAAAPGAPAKNNDAAKPDSAGGATDKSAPPQALKPSKAKAKGRG